MFSRHPTWLKLWKSEFINITRVPNEVIRLLVGVLFDFSQLQQFLMLADKNWTRKNGLKGFIELVIELTSALLFVVQRFNNLDQVSSACDMIVLKGWKLLAVCGWAADEGNDAWE